MPSSSIKFQLNSGEGIIEIRWLPLITKISTILTLYWNKHITRCIQFFTDYLELISKYGHSCLVKPVIQTFKFAAISNKKNNNNANNNNKSVQDHVECHVLYEPTENDRSVDVIFIHGLHGSIRNTWKQGKWNSKPETRIFRSSSFTDLTSCETEQNNNNNEPYADCWPKQWIPQDIPSARVIALTYTTDPYLWRPIWLSGSSRSSIEERGKNMRKLLENINVGEKPIIWVAHSKGGLFVKQIIVEAWEMDKSDIVSHTKGIFFYSVPHKGSSLAALNAPFLAQSIELIEVKKDNPVVLDLHSRFLKICEEVEHFKPELFSFFETKLTLMSLIYLRIVSQESADPEIGELCGVELDHREICKPRSRNCFLYKPLKDMILRIHF